MSECLELGTFIIHSFDCVLSILRRRRSSYAISWSPVTARRQWTVPSRPVCRANCRSSGVRACRVASVRAENRFGQFSDLTTTARCACLRSSNAAKRAEIVASFPGRAPASIIQHTRRSYVRRSADKTWL